MFRFTLRAFSINGKAYYLLIYSVANSFYKKYTKSSLKIYQIYTKFKYVTKNNKCYFFNVFLLFHVDD